MEDIIEVIIFGKGYGESILINLNNKWIVIDSFIEPISKLPMAIRYLQDNKIDEKNIVGIICTHWDNDHIKGISEIIKIRKKCDLPVYVPICFTEKKVLEYVCCYSDDNFNLTSEFHKVLLLYKKKQCKLNWAIAGRTLLGKEIGDGDIEIKALSPSDEQFKLFLDMIVLPKDGDLKKSFLNKENSISIATYIKTCVDSILLGGDLENSSKGGWGSICESYYYNDKSHVFKIPHHGSETGYCAKVWEVMVDYPISIITRFNNRHLPTDEMINKIKQNSVEVYVLGAAPENDKATLKNLKKYNRDETVISVESLDYQYGYVRLHRSNHDVTWSVETYGAVNKY